ncbi:MAG: succinyl-diaminopimelate desuccinylase [Pseudomonadota bacterium]
MSRTTVQALQDAAFALTRELIARPSITPEDAGCQALIGERLRTLGFEVQDLPFGEVSNLWAVHPGDEATPADGPVLCFAGHTDVVPTGPLDRWSSPPFEPTVRDGRLYGRGAADMKSGVAAMVTALEAWIAHTGGRGRLALLLTSDEEGPARDGTRRVIETLEQRGQRIDWCVIGEPSSQGKLGDIVRVGRRGSLTGRLRVIGKQGHVAYPHKARNPIHGAAPALAELVATRWDEGNEYFPPTSFQIAQAQAGTGASNVIPAHLDVVFNFRHSTESTVESLQDRVLEILGRHGLTEHMELVWDDPASPPFLSKAGALAQAVREVLPKHTGTVPTMDTGGGTSDGRFIAPAGIEVVELGPVNASIHQIDEHIDVPDIGRLTAIYLDLIDALIGSPQPNRPVM